MTTNVEQLLKHLVRDPRRDRTNKERRLCAQLASGPAASGTTRPRRRAGRVGPSRAEDRRSGGHRRSWGEGRRVRSRAGEALRKRGIRWASHGGASRSCWRREVVLRRREGHRDGERRWRRAAHKPGRRAREVGPEAGRGHPR